MSTYIMRLLPEASHPFHISSSLTVIFSLYTLALDILKHGASLRRTDRSSGAQGRRSQQWLGKDSPDGMGMYCMM